MGGPKVTDYWIKLVREFALNEDPKPSAPEIRRRLVQWATETGHSPQPPSVRKIVELVNEAMGLTDSDKRQYRLFRWPESMESGAVPWEASRALLDLQKEHWRPHHIPNRVGRWYWRATQAMPGADWRERLQVAGHLAAMEGMGRRPEINMGPLRSYLAYRAWEPEGAKAYDEAIESGRVVRYEGWVTGTSDDNLADLASNLIGMDSPAANWAVADILKQGPLASRPESELKGWVRRERKGRSQ